MEKQEIMNRVQEIFRDVFDDEDIVIDEHTTSDHIEDWDSLTNIQLVVSIERSMGIRFTSAEIPSWKNVGDMVECISKKVSE